jgi:hypothetical protein
MATTRLRHFLTVEKVCEATRRNNHHQLPAVAMSQKNVLGHLPAPPISPIMTRLPERPLINPDTPLRLEVAANVAYPDELMTGQGLRKEAMRGKSEIEQTAPPPQQDNGCGWVNWPLVLTRLEAAVMCRISPETFDDWVRKGILPKPIRRTRRWSRVAIERALAGEVVTSPAEVAYSPFRMETAECVFELRE